MTLRIDPATTLLAALAACTLGCLSKEVTHVLTLEDDGGVTWTIIEAHVRSAETEPEQRQAENDAYLKAALNDELAATLVMADAGARSVRTVVLRDTPPFRVEVEGRFSSFDELREAWARAGLPGALSLERTATGATYTLTLPPGVTPVSTVPDDTPWASVVEEADRIVVVPASGAFDEAQGFERRDDGMFAEARARPECGGSDPCPTTWSLSWTPSLPSK